MPLRRSASYSILLASLVLGIASACSDPGEPRTPAAVEPLTPSPISAQAGASVQLAVRVTDNRGDPMPGVAVSWTVVSGGGTISGGASGQDGRAQAVWVLGVQAGEQRAQATVDGAGSALFTADAEPLDAPVIAAIQPAVLRPGITATITGAGFAATIADNAVTVAGVAAGVTAASPTELTITIPPAGLIPCQPTRPVPVTVTVSGLSATRDHPLEVATQRSLGPGESLLITDAGAARCNEFANNGGRYVIAVFNSSKVLNSTAAFRLRGASATAAAGSPLIAALAAGEAEALSAGAAAGGQTPPRLLASGPPDELRRALRERARGHEAMLARNLELLRRLGPRQVAARDAAGAAAANAGIAASYAAVPPPNVGDTMSLRIPNANVAPAQMCNNFIQVTARVAYSGTRAVVFEDINAPLATRIDSLYVKLGEEYDNTIHSIIAQYFGDPLALDATTDDNGRVYMLFSKVVNDFSNPPFAFVWSGDLYPRSACNQSNVAEVFYARVPTVLGSHPFDVSNSRGWYRFTRGVLAHEVKHIASFAARVSLNATTFEETWLEEATGRLAEELYARSAFNLTWKGNTAFAQGLRCAILVDEAPCVGNEPWSVLPAMLDLWDYLDEIETRTLLGRPDGAQDASFYGSGWGFVRWAVDHYATNEAAFLRSLTQQPSLAGVANLEARTGRPFTEMLADYMIALATDDRPGFSPTRAELRMPSWNLPDLFEGISETLEGFPRPHPLVPRAVTFGNFDVSVSTLRAGTASIFELSGTQAAAQLIELMSPAGGSPPPTLGLHIVRVQ